MVTKTIGHCVRETQTGGMIYFVLWSFKWQVNKSEIMRIKHNFLQGLKLVVKMKRMQSPQNLNRSTPGRCWNQSILMNLPRSRDLMHYNISRFLKENSTAKIKGRGCADSRTWICKRRHTLTNRCSKITVYIRSHFVFTWKSRWRQLYSRWFYAGWHGWECSREIMA